MRSNTTTRIRATSQRCITQLLNSYDAGDSVACCYCKKKEQHGGLRSHLQLTDSLGHKVSCNVSGERTNDGYSGGEACDKNSYFLPSRLHMSSSFSAQLLTVC
jgi:hypothetical protein